MMSALLLIGAAALICLAATPFLAVLWLISKWNKWVNNMVNGSEKKDDGKEVLKLLAKLIAK